MNWFCGPSLSPECLQGSVNNTAHHSVHLELINTSLNCDPCLHVRLESGFNMQLLSLLADESSLITSTSVAESWIIYV